MLISCWWQGLVGLDGACIPDDLTFANRAAALALAVRLHGTDPSEFRGPGEYARKTAEKLFALFQEQKTAQEAFQMRLGFAYICAMTAPAEKHNFDAIERRARWFASYFGKPDPRAAKAARQRLAG
jgi:hypothetical protein